MTFIEGIRIKYRLLCFTYLKPKQITKQIPLQVMLLYLYTQTVERNWREPQCTMVLKVWCDSVDIALIHGKVRWNTDKITVIYNGFPDSDWLHFLIWRGKIGRTHV